MTFKELFFKHNGKLSFKVRSYIDIYDIIFQEYNDKKINILEIGVLNGGSLEIYAKYFKNAKRIIGVDINKNCSTLKFTDDRISVIIGNITLDSTISEISSKLENEGLDIIIDDGSHFPEHIIIAFAKLFPLLNDGGIYIIEDLCASYWKSYKGGIFNPRSSVNFLKRLIDIINFIHWNSGGDNHRAMMLKPFEDELGIRFLEEELACIYSISFYDSLCLIRKKIPEKFRLVVVGQEEPITKNLKANDGKIWNQAPQEVNEDFDLDPLKKRENVP